VPQAFSLLGISISSRPAAKQAAEKLGFGVILSEAKNLSST
jgi:hypothetical protein